MGKNESYIDDIYKVSECRRSWVYKGKVELGY